MDPIHKITRQNSLYPEAVKRLKWGETFLQVLGISAAVIQHGLQNLTRNVQWELGIAVFVSMFGLTAILAMRYRWSLAKPSFYQRHRALVLISAGWCVMTLAIIIFGPLIPPIQGQPIGRPLALLLASELCLVLRAFLVAMTFTRRTTARMGTNPALFLVGSFVFLVIVGTVLLMMPKAYASAEVFAKTELLERFRVALFTATSASCVTGLIVVDTSVYWSQTGLCIIMGLFQIGGLGIMTFGAFFAVVSGRSMMMRESATLHDVFEAEGFDQVRRLVIGIFGFTLATELLGAILLSGLWSDLPLGQQVFHSLFHSVSAFCNAGFSLQSDSFIGMDTRWQVWGVVTMLIIIGGLGFAVLYNIGIVLYSYFSSIQKTPLFNLSRTRTHLSVSSRIVIVTTIILLVVGMVVYYLLESTSDSITKPPSEDRVAHAWFQSVTFRTAGFNSVDHGQMQPATKLFAIFLMFIGAAPGSTGGGVKVMVFALACLRLSSILQGRQRIEVGNRTIADDVVNRALTVLALGVVVTMTTTMLLVIFEQKEAYFLDHLFEATSAFATVGVSAIDTSTLQYPSQYVIIATMFLGRVGPLTILIGLAGQMKTPNYTYPVERVTLG